MQSCLPFKPASGRPERRSAAAILLLRLIPCPPTSQHSSTCLALLDPGAAYFPPLPLQMADSVTEKLSELGVRDPEADAAEDGSEHDAASDSQEQGSNGSTGPKDQKLIVKFLMSNAAAGAIIGKGGASIAELQDNSGARLQLSRAAEFFPGTADRVMLIAGTLNAVLAALHLVLTKLQNEQVSKETCLNSMLIACLDKKYTLRRCCMHRHAISLRSLSCACVWLMHICAFCCEFNETVGARSSSVRALSP